MKKRFIMLGIVCLFMTGCQTAQKTIPEITTIAPADSAHEETETNKEERAEDASVAVKSLKIGSSKGNPDDLSSLYQTIQTHSDHNHCKSNKHRINHLASPGFRISNAKHKITDPDNISDKQQAAAIKKHRQKEQGVNCFHTILRKYKLLYFPHSRHLHEFRRCIHSFPMFHSTIAKTDPVQDSSLTYLRLFTNMPTTVKIIIVTIQYSTPG